MVQVCVARRRPSGYNREGEKRNPWRGMSSSVLIALSEPFVRIGVQVTVEAEDEFTVAGQVDDPNRIAQTVDELRPDILILDTHYQQRDRGLMQAVLQKHPKCLVLVMVDHTDAECTVRRLLAGPTDRWPDREAVDDLKECCHMAFRESARGCLPKGAAPEMLLEALRAMVGGEVWAGPGISKYFVELARPEDAEPPQPLTKREGEVVGLLVQGLSNKEIAGRLGLSEQTVKNHVARIMVKVEVRNRVELVLYAVRERLV